MRVLISWMPRALICRASICSVRYLAGHCGALRGSGGWRVTIHEFCVRIVTQFSEIPRKFRMKQANLSFEHYLNYLSYSGNLSPKFCRNNIKMQSFTVVPKLPRNPAMHHSVSPLNPLARRGITFNVPLAKRQTINVHTMHSLLTASQENPVP